MNNTCLVFWFRQENLVNPLFNTSVFAYNPPHAPQLHPPIGPGLLSHSGTRPCAFPVRFCFPLREQIGNTRRGAGRGKAACWQNRPKSAATPRDRVVYTILVSGFRSNSVPIPVHLGTALGPGFGPGVGPDCVPWGCARSSGASGVRPGEGRPGAGRWPKPHLEEQTHFACNNMG